MPLIELPKDELEILSFEATTTAYVSENAARFDGVAHRLRVMGSLAITLCHLAAGRVDGVVSLKARGRSTSPRRSCSCASAGSRSTCRTRRRSASAPLDLVARSRVAAALNAELCERLCGRSAAGRYPRS